MLMPGHETILLVEDEAPILDLAHTVLARCGYQTITALSAEQAIGRAEAHGGRIDLLITDVMMPGMTGTELAQRLVSAYPGLACLFMSGYTGSALQDLGLDPARMHFIQKPFALAELSVKVRQVLDA